MKGTTIVVFIALGWMSLLLAVIQAHGQVASNERHRETIANAQSPSEVADAHKALFEDSNALGALKYDPNVSIALQAAWETCRRTVKSAGAPQRFLGLVEGRTTLTVPLRWEVKLAVRALSNERELLRDVITGYLPSCAFLKPDDEAQSVVYEPVHLQKTVLDLWVPEGTRVRQSEGLVEFTTDQGKVTFSQKVLADPRGSGFGNSGGTASVPLRRCTIHIGREQSFVAMFRSKHGRYPVVCIDSRTGEVIWRNEVWAPGPIFSSGPGMHEVSVVLGRDVVAFFGQASGDCYVEAFDLKTGKPAFRFSTYYSSLLGR